jgi:hypothetical protein
MSRCVIHIYIKYTCIYYIKTHEKSNNNRNSPSFLPTLSYHILSFLPFSLPLPPPLFLYFLLLIHRSRKNPLSQNPLSQNHLSHNPISQTNSTSDTKKRAKVIFEKPNNDDQKFVVHIKLLKTDKRKTIVSYCGEISYKLQNSVQTIESQMKKMWNFYLLMQ